MTKILLLLIFALSNTNVLAEDTSAIATFAGMFTEEEVAKMLLRKLDTCNVTEDRGWAQEVFRATVNASEECLRQEVTRPELTQCVKKVTDLGRLFSPEKLFLTSPFTAYDIHELQHCAGGVIDSHTFILLFKMAGCGVTFTAAQSKLLKERFADNKTDRILADAVYVRSICNNIEQTSSMKDMLLNTQQNTLNTLIAFVTGR